MVTESNSVGLIQTLIGGPNVYVTITQYKHQSWRDRYFLVLKKARTDFQIKKKQLILHFFIIC